MTRKPGICVSPNSIRSIFPLSFVIFDVFHKLLCEYCPIPDSRWEQRRWISTTKVYGVNFAVTTAAVIITLSSVATFRS
ncbi:hypothetical protein VNO78_26971 [Psophocarpus tetragonolobus]|uniref:Uncharacterized protein n=1 Tax=Psophocarpus tetragonolobus TaxID=3891 RepID=A0AAN9X9R9_PSOTE